MVSGQFCTLALFLSVEKLGSENLVEVYCPSKDELFHFFKIFKGVECAVHKTVKMKLLLIGRVSPSVAQRQKAVLQTKLGKTKVVWFPVLVSTLILQMTP